MLACNHFGSEIQAQVVLVLVQFSLHNFLELFSVKLPNLLIETGRYLNTVHEFLPSLLSIRTAKQLLVGDGVLDFWFDLAMREADYESRGPSDARISALGFLVDIWVAFPAFFEDREELTSGVISVLKRGARDRYRLVQHFALNKLFYMLEAFRQDRNPYAPILYKTLVFALVENYHDSATRELIMRNFALADKEMPISILIEPVVKQIQVSSDATYNLFDVDFFINAACHPRLSAEHAVSLLDVLGKTFISELALHRATQVPLLMLVSRFIDSDIVQELVLRLTAYLLKLVVAAEVGRSGNSLQGQRHAIIGLIKAVLDMRSYQLNVKVKASLLESNAEVRQATQQNSAHICRLIGLFGDVEGLVAQHALQLKERRQLLDSDTSIWSDPSPSGKKLYRPTLTPLGRANIDIDRARRRRLEKEIKEQILIELKEAEEQRRRQQTKKTGGRRRFTVLTKAIDSRGAEAPQRRTASLVELSAEEEEAVGKVLRRYSAALKLLFKKYSSSGYIRNLKSGTFEGIAERKASLAGPEYFKLLKEQGVGPAMLSFEEFDGLLKAFCRETQRSGGSLDFEGYLKLLVQIAVCVFSKPPQDLSYLHPVLSVKALLELFRQSTAEQGLPTKIYDETGLRTGDKNIDKLVRLLEMDPDEPLPEGYQRVTEREVYVEYSLPSYIHLKDSQAVAISLMDELIHKLFGSHFLEPTVGLTEVTRVKPPAVRKGKPVVPEVTTYKSIGQVPGFTELSPVIKYETIKLQGELPAEDLYHVAKALDDLIFSLDRGSAVLISRPVAIPQPSLSMQKVQKVEQREELREEQGRIEQAQRERKRKLRKQLIEQKIRQEREFQDAKQQDEAQEKERLKEQDQVLKQKLEAKRWREQQERKMLLQEWRLKRQADDRQRQEEERRKLAEDFSKKLQNREQFRLKEFQKVRQLLDETQQKHDEERQAEFRNIRLAEEQKEKSRRQFKAKLDALRRQREVEQVDKYREDIQLNDAAVTAVLTEFKGTVDVLFKHFCRLSAGANLEVLNSRVLPYPGYNKFGGLFKIWPSLMTADDGIKIFRLLTKDKIPEAIIPTSLSRSDFNDVLLRIALKAKRHLGLRPDSRLKEALGKLLDWMHVTPDAKQTLEVLRLLSAKLPLDTGPKRDKSSTHTRQ
jgi:hypothetical protein